MLKFINRYMVMEEQKSEGAAGGGKPPKPPAPPAAEKKDEPASDNLDEFGYEKPEEKKPPAPPKEEPKKESEAKSGYDNEPKVDDDKSDDKEKAGATGYDQEPDDKKADGDKEEIKDELKLNVEGLLDDEVKEIVEFAKVYKLTKEAAQALADTRKAEVKKYEQTVAEQKKLSEKKKQELRKEWYNELKSDPTFGGEKFAHNVAQVDKVINEFAPNIKKKLTESKEMLPPYIMRDLFNIASHLYGTKKIVHGEPTVDKSKEEEESNDPLSFYN